MVRSTYSGGMRESSRPCMVFFFSCGSRPMTRCGPQPWMCWSSRGGRGPCATRSFRPTTLPSTAAHPRRRLAVRLGQPPILFQARGAALRAITGRTCEKNRPTYLEICSNVRPEAIARCGPSPCGGMPRSTQQTRLAIVHASPPPPAGGCHPDKRAPTFLFASPWENCRPASSKTWGKWQLPRMWRKRPPLFST